MKETTSVILLFSLLFSCSKPTFPECNIESKSIKYPFIAHSHNDYDQTTPITTALDHGFTSLEVDIIYDGKNIRVSHDDDNLSVKPEFETLYLNPIFEKQKDDSQGLMLLVDVKEYSLDLLKSLNAMLAKYDERLVKREAPWDLEGKIKIVISGDIPRAQIISDTSNVYLFIDGRLTDDDLEAKFEIVPLISIDISDIPILDGTYSNKGSIDERVLKTIELVHSKDKMIRFWKTKNNESTWVSLIELEVDIIGVDDIKYFCQVMKKNGFIK